MQYFKHMSNMRHDTKIKRLINKYSLEGYGLYNLIIESIVEKISSGSPLPELYETCDDMAIFYNGNSAKIQEMVSFMIGQELFELSEINGRVQCSKVYKFLEQSQTRSDQLRELIARYKDVTDKYGVSETNMKDKDKDIDQNKDKEETQTQTKTVQVEYNGDSFEIFWNMYGKKVGKEESERKWKKINPDIYPVIMAHVEEYVKSKSNKQFRLNPATYLNGKHWNDEIIPDKPARPDSQDNLKRFQEMEKTL